MSTTSKVRRPAKQRLLKRRAAKNRAGQLPKYGPHARCSAPALVDGIPTIERDDAPTEPLSTATQACAAGMARQILKRSTADFFRNAGTWRADRYNSDGDFERTLRSLRHAPLLIATVTTGVGKTTELLAAMAKSDQPTLYSTPLVSDAQKPVDQYPETFMRRRPRADAPGEQNHCAYSGESGILSFRVDGTPIRIPDHWTNSLNGVPLTLAMPDAHQSVAGNVCSHCPKGIRKSITNPMSQMTPWEKAHAQERLDESFSGEDQILLGTSACWIDENIEAANSLHISVTAKGYSPGDVRHSIKGGEDHEAGNSTVSRSCVLDETLKSMAGELITLSREDIAAGLENIKAHRMSATSQKVEMIAKLPSAKTEKGEDAMRKRIRSLEDVIEYGRRVEPILWSLFTLITDAGIEDGDHHCFPEAAHLAIKDAIEIADIRDLPDFERAVWDRQQLKHLPHRITGMILRSILNGSATLCAAGLAVFAPAPQLETIIEGDTPVYLADATPDPALKAIMLDKGATHIQVTAQQNVTAYYDARRFRGSPDKNRRTRQMETAEAKRKLGLIRRVQADPKYNNGASWYVIGNKSEMIPLLELLSGQSTGDMSTADLLQLAAEHHIGWYGRHHRAHNDWTDCNLIQFGDPTIPDKVRAEAWMAYRAALIHAGVEGALDLPLYTDEWLGRGKRSVNVEGVMVPFPRRTHANDYIHAFMQELVDAIRIQADGRSRAANAERKLFILQFGGTPCAARAAHGIHSESAILDTSPTDKERKVQQHQDAMARISTTFTEILDLSAMVTEVPMLSLKTLNAQQQRHGEAQTSSATYQQFLASPAVLPFVEFMAKTGRGARYARLINPAISEWGTTPAQIEARAAEIYQAQISKGGQITNRDVILAMLNAADTLANSPREIDELVAEYIHGAFADWMIDPAHRPTAPPAAA